MLCSDAIHESPGPLLWSDFVIKCTKKLDRIRKKSVCFKCDEYLVRCNTKLKFLICTSRHLCIVPQQHSGPGRLTVEVSVIRHTNPIGLLWVGDQLVAEAATYKKYNKHTRRTSMPTAGFVPAIPTQSSGCRPTPQTARPTASAHTLADLLVCIYVQLPVCCKKTYGELEK
jgi:hypothetical protein